jgi:type II secretory pathway pseudopilin PulG
MRSSAGGRGFSLVELLVAVAVFMASAGLLFHFAARSQRFAVSQPEAADLHQRLRIAAGMMQRDLANAGAGPLHGAAGRTLANHLPPILPARSGARAPDPELSAFNDRVSVLFVPEEGWHATLAADMASPDAALIVNTAAGCPGAGVCGFVRGTRAAIFDTTAPGAGFELFSVTDITAGLAHGAPNPPFSRSYASATAVVVPMVHHVYYRDPAANRLMLYDGYMSDLPLVDNVVGLRFTYFADPNPAVVAAPPAGSGSCLYAAGSPAVPLLPALAGLTLVPLTMQQLIDGPFCGIAPARFDADLLRIRRVRVTLRVQVDAAHLRGSGEHFVNAGSSTAHDQSVKDYEMTFDVAPRNMSPAR